MSLPPSPLAVVLLVAVAASAAPGKVPYRLGMTREAVRAVPACAPYVDVPSTGGLECPNFVLDRKRNVSFVFDEAGLTKIQFWFAEAASRADAMKATDDLLAYLQGAHGPLKSRDLPDGAEVTTAALFAALDKAQAPNGPAKVQLTLRESPRDVFVFASILRDPRHGHYVFLYHVRPPK